MTLPLCLFLSAALFQGAQAAEPEKTFGILNGYIYQKVEAADPETLPAYPLWILPDSPEIRAQIQQEPEAEPEFSKKLRELERFRSVTSLYGTMHRSDSEGYFRLNLPAGRYLLLSQFPYLSSPSSSLIQMNRQATQGSLPPALRSRLLEWSSRADLYPFPLSHGYWAVEFEMRPAARLTVDLNWYNLRPHFSCCLGSRSWRGSGQTIHPEQKENE